MLMEPRSVKHSEKFRCATAVYRSCFHTLDGRSADSELIVVSGLVGSSSGIWLISRWLFCQKSETRLLGGDSFLLRGAPLFSHSPKFLDFRNDTGVNHPSSPPPEVKRR